MKPKIILAGGSGFLGGVLADFYQRRGWNVVVLTRSPKSRTEVIQQVIWDGKSQGDWGVEIDGAEAVINLTGRSVDCRYTAKNRELILNSRIDSTLALGKAIAIAKKPPKVWLNSSTATIYKHSFERPMGEDGEIGATPEAKDEFSVHVAQSWERALDEVETPKTRKVKLRAAMVLGKSGGVFPVLRRMTQFSLGGKMASGLQYVSWLHENDFGRAIDWIISHHELCGAVNLAAPNPLPNKELMELFRKILSVPFGLPAPLYLLELGAFFLRTETELIIKSRRVVPTCLLASGFQFNFFKAEAALEELAGKCGVLK